MDTYTKQSIQKLDAAKKNNALNFDSLLKKLKKLKKKELDKLFHALHEEEFKKIDCLECGRCCSDLGPLLFQSDIDRLAKAVKIPASEFYRTYIEMDEDGDYIFNTHPCPFLGKDNYCAVYENRPKACREYPHTDRDKMFQVLETTIKNTAYCPAVFNILRGMESKLKG